MEIDSIPIIFQNKIRLSIISLLILGDKNFKEIKETINASDGNLGAQLNKLETSGYISCKKEFVNRKPQSEYSITKLGRKNFEEYVELLSQILKNYKR